MKLPVVAGLLALLVQQTPPSQPPTKATIEGVVVRVGTGEPIDGAQVSVMRQGSGQPGVFGPAGLPAVPPPPPVGVTGVTGTAGGTLSTFTTSPVIAPLGLTAVTTDGGGKFVIKDLDPGAYRVIFAANGYTRQEYGQKVFPGQGTTINVAAGQSVTNLVVRLTPAGTVTGRIRDRLGRPLTGVPVQLLKASYNAIGAKAFQSAGSDRTDDRGEYRLYWVTPGRYYLAAGSGPGPTARPASLGGVVSSSPNEIPNTSYALTFYPGAPDVDSAAVLNVLPGSELSAIDLTVPVQQLRRIRGRVIDSRTRQLPPAVNISLAYQNLSGGSGSFGSGSGYNPATGTFELQNVVPGPYLIQASVQDATPPPVDIAARVAALATRATGSARIVVSDTDLENIVLTLVTPSSIQGRLTVDAQPLTALGPSERFRVMLRASVDGMPAQNVSNSTQPQPVTADGTFRIDGVVPGEYMVSLAGPLPQDFYLKEARFDQIDVLSQPMRFSGGSSGVLDVVVGAGAAQVTGRVVDAKDQPVAGVMAVLIPDRQRNRVELYKSASTDQNGAFTFRGVAPGDYKVFSWEALESFAYYDPAVLQQFEQRGKAVRVSERSKETVDVRIIPAETTP